MLVSHVDKFNSVASVSLCLAATPGEVLSCQLALFEPAGKLTETQVLMSHVNKLHLDRYGFIVTEAEAHVRAARAKRTPGQIKREQRHVAKWRRMLGSNRLVSFAVQVFKRCLKLY